MKDETTRWSQMRQLPMVSATVLGLFAIIGAIGPYLVRYPPEAIDLASAYEPPVFAGGSVGHLLGTDGLGRDVLSRLVAGARISLMVALAVVLIAGLIGLIVALIAGYSGGRIDAILSRTTDAAMAFPFVLLAVVIAAVFGPSIRNVIIVLVAALWPHYARVLRSEVLQLRNEDFVAISKVQGASHAWIIARHILPNLVGSLLVLATLQVGLAMIAEGSLSFLGIGVPPPAASWGNMLASGRDALQSSWWLPVLPAVALSMTVLASNVLGDWLRNHFDPTMRR